MGRNVMTKSCEITSFDLDTIARDAFKDLDRSEELLHKTLINLKVG